jgi:hypothetical protein
MKSGERLMAVRVSMYLIEGDQWQGRPLHLEVLKYLREQNVAGAVAYHAVAGFIGRMRVKTATLVDAGGKLPIIITFIDTDEDIRRVLPQLKDMAANRLIVREDVVVEQGSLD